MNYKLRGPLVSGAVSLQRAGEDVFVHPQSDMVPRQVTFLPHVIA